MTFTRNLRSTGKYMIEDKNRNIAISAIEVNFINDGNLISFDFMLNSRYLLFQIVFKIGKLNSTYGGLKGRKTRVERKILRFPPTRLS